MNNWFSPAVFEGPSPVFSYLGAVVTLFFDGDLNTLRMISVIFGSLTVPFQYFFGKEMYNRKVGLLSALFLCFSAYHIVYSRIIMLEAFTLFFITAFLYFFWLCERNENNQKSMKYAIIAGAMMGMAIAAKYLPAFLVLSVFAYILWIKKFSFKALFNKKIILMLVSAFLVFSPLIIGFIATGENPVDFYILRKLREPETQTNAAINRFDQGVSSWFVSGTSIPSGMLITRGLIKINEILAWGAYIFTPTWATLFALSVISLFLMAFLFHLRGLINRENESSFIIISICVIYISILIISTTKYYLIYSFPYIFIFIAHMAVASFDNLRKEKGYKNIFRIFIILLTVIMLLFYIITGATSSSWEKGEELAWVKSAVEYIKDDITKDGNNENILIGLAGILPSKAEQIFYGSDLNTSTFRIVKPGTIFGEKKNPTNVVPVVDLEMIHRMQPDYLIVTDIQYNIFFKTKDKKEILKYYLPVFHSNTFYSYNGYVFKRVNTSVSISSAKGAEGNINPYIYKRSVPNKMKVGSTYTILVNVKNTGDYRRVFTVKLHSDENLIFIEKSYREITLEKGSTRLLKFKITPIKGFARKVSLLSDLYVENGIQPIDSVGDTVFIEK